MGWLWVFGGRIAYQGQVNLKDLNEKEGLVWDLADGWGLDTWRRRRKKTFQEEREECVVSLRKTNQLCRSKAFTHPFCINLVFTMCKVLVRC